MARGRAEIGGCLLTGNGRAAKKVGGLMDRIGFHLRNDRVPISWIFEPRCAAEIVTNFV